MKSKEQLEYEQGILALMTIFGFAIPPLWIFALMAYIGGYGR